MINVCNFHTSRPISDRELAIQARDWLNKVAKLQNKKLKMAALNRRWFLRRKIIILLLLRKRRQRLKNRKRFWVSKIYEERNRKGEFNILVRELMLADHNYFFRLFQMSPGTFEVLLSSSCTVH